LGRYGRLRPCCLPPLSSPSPRPDIASSPDGDVPTILEPNKLPLAGPLGVDQVFDPSCSWQIIDLYGPILPCLLHKRAPLASRLSLLLPTVCYPDLFDLGLLSSFFWGWIPYPQVFLRGSSRRLIGLASGVVAGCVPFLAKDPEKNGPENTFPLLFSQIPFPLANTLGPIHAAMP